MEALCKMHTMRGVSRYYYITKHKKNTNNQPIIYRKETIMKHLSSEYHKKCNNAYQKKIEGIRQSDKIPLANYISKANSDLAYIYNIL